MTLTYTYPQTLQCTTTETRQDSTIFVFLPEDDLKVTFEQKLKTLYVASKYDRSNEVAVNGICTAQ